MACGHCYREEAHRDPLPFLWDVPYVGVCMRTCLYLEGSRNLFGHTMPISLTGHPGLQVKLRIVHCEAQHQTEAKMQEKKKQPTISVQLCGASYRRGNAFS